MSAVVVIMRTLLLTGTRATGFVVVPLLRPTVAIIVAKFVLRSRYTVLWLFVFLNDGPP